MTALELDELTDRRTDKRSQSRPGGKTSDETKESNYSRPLLFCQQVGIGYGVTQARERRNGKMKQMLSKPDQIITNKTSPPKNMKRK